MHEEGLKQWQIRKWEILKGLMTPRFYLASYERESTVLACQMDLQVRYNLGPGGRLVGR